VASHIAGGKGGLKRVKLMEAEHAVADYIVGASAACRDLIFPTATSSVGLDHMTETTRSLGASGLGNAMIIDVYRATANYPLCIEGDPSDTLAHRDDGFIQICARGKQQIYDTILQAPCLGMHPEIMTPTMPGYYGIKDSHRNARLVLEPDRKVHAFQDAWIPPCPLPGLINGDTAFGNCVTSRHFQGFKVSQKKRMERVLDILPAWARTSSGGSAAPGSRSSMPWGSTRTGPWTSRSSAWAPTSARSSRSARPTRRMPASRSRHRDAAADALPARGGAAPAGEGEARARREPGPPPGTRPSHPRHRRRAVRRGAAAAHREHVRRARGADVSEATWERMLDHAKSALWGKPAPPYAFFHEGAEL